MILHQSVDLILVGFLLNCFPGVRKHLRHGRARTASLAGMSLIDDDGETSLNLLVTDLLQDKGELLHGGDDDLLAILNEFM